MTVSPTASPAPLDHKLIVVLHLANTPRRHYCGRRLPTFLFNHLPEWREEREGEREREM